MDTKEPRGPLTFDELKDVLFGMVQDQYANNTDPDFDVQACAFLIHGDHECTIAMIMGEPGEMVPALIKAQNPRMYGVVSAAWCTRADCDGNKIEGSRTEGVLFNFESTEQAEYYIQSVTRNPLPVLGVRHQHDYSQLGGRMTHLLFNPPRN